MRAIFKLKITQLTARSMSHSLILMNRFCLLEKALIMGLFDSRKRYRYHLTHNKTCLIIALMECSLQLMNSTTKTC